MQAPYLQSKISILFSKGQLFAEWNRLQRYDDVYSKDFVPNFRKTLIND